MLDVNRKKGKTKISWVNNKVVLTLGDTCSADILDIVDEVIKDMRTETGAFHGSFSFSPDKIVLNLVSENKESIRTYQRTL